MLASNLDVLMSNPGMLASNLDVLMSNPGMLASNLDVLVSNPGMLVHPGRSVAFLRAGAKYFYKFFMLPRLGE